MSTPRNLLTEARKALQQRIEGVTLANGSRTNIGTNLFTGWFNEILKTTGLPDTFCVIQPATGLPPQKGPGAMKVFQGFYVIGAARIGLENYEDALDDMQVDLLESLVTTQGTPCKWLPRGVLAITVGAPEAFPPGTGQPYAGVLIPVHLHTIIQEKP